MQKYQTWLATIFILPIALVFSLNNWQNLVQKKFIDLSWIYPKIIQTSEKRNLHVTEDPSLAIEDFLHNYLKSQNSSSNNIAVVHGSGHMHEQLDSMTLQSICNFKRDCHTKIEFPYFLRFSQDDLFTNLQRIFTNYDYLLVGVLQEKLQLEDSRTTESSFANKLIQIWQEGKLVDFNLNLEAQIPTIDWNGNPALVLLLSQARRQLQVVP